MRKYTKCLLMISPIVGITIGGLLAYFVSDAPAKIVVPFCVSSICLWLIFYFLAGAVWLNEEYHMAVNKARKRVEKDVDNLKEEIGFSVKESYEKGFYDGYKASAEILQEKLNGIYKDMEPTIQRISEIAKDIQHSAEKMLKEKTKEE